MGLTGREYQLATADLTFVGPGGTFTFTSTRNVTYKTALPKDPVRNKSGQIIGYVTKDEDNAGCTMRFLQSEWRAFKLWAAGQYPGVKLGLMRFDVNHTVGEDPSDYATDKLEGVMVNEDGRTLGNDQKEGEIEVPFFVRKIRMSGGDLF